MSIKVGKIQTRAFMSRAEIAEKVKSCGFKNMLKFLQEDSGLKQTPPMSVPSRE